MRASNKTRWGLSWAVVLDRYHFPKPRRHWEDVRLLLERASSLWATCRNASDGCVDVDGFWGGRTPGDDLVKLVVDGIHLLVGDHYGCILMLKEVSSSIVTTNEQGR